MPAVSEGVMVERPRVVVLIPYRGADVHRVRAYGAVRAQADTLGWDVYAGDSGDLPFSIARTWNHLAALADADGRWDVAVRWAADVLLADTRSLRRAVGRVRAYVRPFDAGVRLTQAESRTYYRTGRVPRRAGPAFFGGISVNTRRMWDTVGGFDPRFEGWGHEDRAFIHGLNLCCGPVETCPGRAVQLWHPRPPRGSTDPYWGRRRANLALYRAEIKSLSTPAEWAAYVAARPAGPRGWICPDHGDDWDGSCPYCPDFVGGVWVGRDGREVTWIRR